MLDPRRVFTIHLVIIAGFALSNVLIAILDGLGHRSLLGFSRLLRLEEEANIPSLFSALALAVCAVVALGNRAHLAPGEPDRGPWGLLAGFFVFLAVDEAAMIHEMANRASQDLNLKGLLITVGVFLYLPVLIWLAWRLLPFWLRQARDLRFALLLGATIYVCGAIGMELVENELHALGFGTGDLPLRIGFIFEECGEMLGVAVLLKAFLDRFARLGGGLLVPLTIRDARVGRERLVQNTAISLRP